MPVNQSKINPQNFCLIMVVSRQIIPKKNQTRGFFMVKRCNFGQKFYSVIIIRNGRAVKVRISKKSF